MIAKNSIRIVSLFLVAAILLFPAVGCSAGTGATSSSHSQASTNEDGEFDFKSVQFRDITIMVPDTLIDSSSGSEDQLGLYFPETAEDPFAFSMHLFVNDGVSYSARDAYEGAAEFEDNAELIEVNGTEFFVQRDNHGDFNSTSILLTLDGAAYSIYIDCKEDLDQAYKKYVDDICWYISCATAPRPIDDEPIPADGISWQEAQSHIGEIVTVYGPVVETTYAQKVSGQPTYLNIGVAYPDKSGVTALIWGEDRSAFDRAPESTYEGKSVCVTGEPYLYNGQCYIKVTSPAQIQIL